MENIMTGLASSTFVLFSLSAQDETRKKEKICYDLINTFSKGSNETPLF